MTDAHTPRCQAPDIARMISRYEHGLLTSAERQRLEAHVLGCDACFAELERGSIVCEACQAPGLAAALTERPVRGVALLRCPAIALMTAGLLLCILMLGKPGPPTELTDFPTEVTLTDIPRAGGTGEVLNELIRAGSGHLNLGHYAQAERFLRTARERAPEDPRAAYLLGLVIALRGDPEGAIPHLTAAAEESADATWLLAIAYLKSGRADRARDLLADIAARGGPHAADALTLSHNIWPN